MLFGSYSIRRKGIPPIKLYVESEYIFLCSSQFIVTPSIEYGDYNEHTFDWIFLSGAAINIIPGLYPYQLVVEYATEYRGDVFMRLIVDAGTPNVQTFDVVISGTPRSTLRATTSITSSTTNPTKLPSTQAYHFEYNSFSSPSGYTSTPIGYMVYFSNPSDTNYLTTVQLQHWNTDLKNWEVDYTVGAAVLNKHTPVTPQTKYRYVTEYVVTTSTINTYVTDFFYTPEISDNNRFVWSTLSNECTTVSDISVTINIPTLTVLTPESYLQSTGTVDSSISVSVFDTPPINVLRDSILYPTTTLASAYTVTYFGSTTIGG